LDIAAGLLALRCLRLAGRRCGREIFLNVVERCAVESGRRRSIFLADRLGGCRRRCREFRLSSQLLSMHRAQLYPACFLAGYLLQMVSCSQMRLVIVPSRRRFEATVSSNGGPVFSCAQATAATLDPLIVLQGACRERRECTCSWRAIRIRTRDRLDSSPLLTLRCHPMKCTSTRCDALREVPFASSIETIEAMADL
jgi:hypothetical protein